MCVDEVEPGPIPGPGLLITYQSSGVSVVVVYMCYCNKENALTMYVAKTRLTFIKNYHTSTQ